MKMSKRSPVALMASGFLLSTALRSSAQMQGGFTTKPQGEFTTKGFTTQTEVDPIGILKIEADSKVPISLSVKDVDVYGLISPAIDSFGKGTGVAAYNTNPTKMTFDVKGVPFGQLLSSAATLAGCELYLLPNMFLIAPTGQLSDEQASVAEPWSAPLAQRQKIRSASFARRIVKEMQKKGESRGLANQLSDSAQKMLLWMLNNQADVSEAKNITLVPDTQVSVSPVSNNEYTLITESTLNNFNLKWSTSAILKNSKILN